MEKMLKCPNCGSKDCKEKIITLEKIGDALLDLGAQGIKYLITGKYNHMEILENVSQINLNTNKKKTYRCKKCWHEWKSK